MVEFYWNVTINLAKLRLFNAYFFTYLLCLSSGNRFGREFSRLSRLSLWKTTLSLEPVGFALPVILGPKRFLHISLNYIQHCFIYRPLDSTVPTDAGIEPRTVATGALAVRRSNQARSHPNVVFNTVKTKADIYVIPKADDRGNSGADGADIRILFNKAVNRGDKRTRHVRDQDFVKFERSRRYCDRYRCQSRRGRARDLVFRDPPTPRTSTRSLFADQDHPPSQQSPPSQQQQYCSTSSYNSSCHLHNNNNLVSLVHTTAVSTFTSTSIL
jgi:hypothetical protein